MITLEIFKNMFTQFYFGPYLMVAIGVYGTFKLVERLIINR